MDVHAKIIVIFLLIIDASLILWLLLHGNTIAVLSPKGFIAFEERNLMIIAILAMLIVVIPVLFLAFFVAWKYRENNRNATYTPDWDHDTPLQIFWWVFPMLIISLLAIINWRYTHLLDPRNTIYSHTKTMTIQVVALRWKWLFIYPDSGIATINYLVLPEKTPVAFELTADEAPMNSFWIPQLGGQIYAMSGMLTQTHLIANGIGTYAGSNAEISGQGFSDMRFVTKSVSQNEYNNWVAYVKHLDEPLTNETYQCLVTPSEDNSPTLFSSVQQHLYSTILMKYMAHSPSTMQQMNQMGSM